MKWSAFKSEVDKFGSLRYRFMIVCDEASTIQITRCGALLSPLNRNNCTQVLAAQVITMLKVQLVVMNGSSVM